MIKMAAWALIALLGCTLGWKITRFLPDHTRAWVRSYLLAFLFFPVITGAVFGPIPIVLFNAVERGHVQVESVFLALVFWFVGGMVIRPVIAVFERRNWTPPGYKKD